ncbi:hypothetical protein Hanom_Chr00s134303g01816521 [Helianthus anomalus]
MDPTTHTPSLSSLPVPASATCYRICTFIEWQNPLATVLPRGKSILPSGFAAHFEHP